MYGYTKLFQSIITSSIWVEDNETRVLWITMLALKNHLHIVEASVVGLARMAGLSVEAVERALKKLSSPDPHSRSKENDGRRIKEVDGGWLILNGHKYQEKCRGADRREYFRIKKQEERSRKNAETDKERREIKRQLDAGKDPRDIAPSETE